MTETERPQYQLVTFAKRGFERKAKLWRFFDV